MANLKKSVAGARMLVLSHSNNVTGAILPVDEIAKIARDAHCMFMLDASHTAGRMPVNLRRLGVSCAVASGHKFLYGPTGTGIAYIGSETLKAQSRFKANTKPCFEHVEDHTPNILGYSGLQASLRFIIKENIDRIRQHDKLMREAMLGSLEMIRKVKILAPDAEEGVATISFTCKDYPPNVISRLLEERFGIQIGNGLCSNQGIHETLSTYPDGCCRISTGFFNSQSDVEYFATSLTSIVHSK
jgi:selenocysteine lyase/cysteine desulfurase